MIAVFVKASLSHDMHGNVNMTGLQSNDLLHSLPFVKNGMTITPQISHDDILDTKICICSWI